MLEPSPIQLWDTSLTLRTGGGHASNPSLANLSSARQPSAFLEYGGDLMFFRLPTGGDNAYIFLSGDDRRYLSAENIPGEQNFVALATYTHDSPSWWKAGATVSFVYLHQVIDLSEIDSGIGTAEVKGNTLNFRPMWGGTWDTNWLAQLELPLNRQMFSTEATGDFLELGPQVTLTRYLARSSQVSLSYAWLRRAYDDTPLREPDGDLLPGTLEVLNYNHLNLRWRQFWDTEKHWSSTARLGFTTARDNGPGYYDFNRYRASGLVRYERDRWALQFEGGALWSDYLLQSVSNLNLTPRSQRNVFAVAEFEYRVWRALKWNVSFAYDQSVGNVALDSYLSRTVTTGVEWEF